MKHNENRVNISITWYTKVGKKRGELFTLTVTNWHTNVAHYNTVGVPAICFVAFWLKLKVGVRKLTCLRLYGYWDQNIKTMNGTRLITEENKIKTPNVYVCYYAECIYYVLSNRVIKVYWKDLFYRPSTHTINKLFLK